MSVASRHATSVLVALILGLVGFGCGGSGATSTTPEERVACDLNPGKEQAGYIFQAAGRKRPEVSEAEIARTVDIVCERLKRIGTKATVRVTDFRSRDSIDAETRTGHFAEIRVGFNPDEVVYSRDEADSAPIGSEGRVRIVPWEDSLITKPGVTDPSTPMLRAGAGELADRYSGAIVVKDVRPNRRPVPGKLGGSFYAIHDRPTLSNQDIEGTEQAYDSEGRPIVALELTPRGAHLFESMKKKLARQAGNASSGASHFAILFDDRVVSIQRPNEQRSPTRILVLGRFKLREAREYATFFEIGEVPVELVKVGGYSN